MNVRATHRQLGSDVLGSPPGEHRDERKPAKDRKCEEPLEICPESGQPQEYSSVERYHDALLIDGAEEKTSCTGAAPPTDAKA